jgi:hypothetical protein
MVRRNLGRAPGIGKRWPYKALDYLPPKHLWKYLAWKSDGAAPESPFQLGKALSGCRKALIVLPESFQEILVAFPVIQSLVQDRPDTQFLLLTRQDLTGFLASLFGTDRVVGLRPEELYWGEPHLKALLSALRDFGPDLTLNLRASTPPLMHWLLRSTGAPIRIQVSPDAPAPFANVALRPADPPNHLRRYMQAAKLWDVSDRPISCTWARLRPSPENLREAAARLNAKGLRPEATRIFLWQDLPLERQRDLFRAAVSERGAKGSATSLLVVNGAGPLYASEPPLPEMLLSVPALQVDSSGLLLGLFAQTARSIGFNGPMLHLAGLAETDVEARFEGKDAVWDTSFLNPRMKVIYAEEPTGTSSASRSSAPA